MGRKKKRNTRARNAGSAEKSQKNKIIVAVVITLVVGMYLGGMLLPALQETSTPSNTVQNVPQGGKQRNMQAQITSVRKQLEQRPESVGLWNKLGHLYFDTDQYPQAIEAYNRSLELAPGDPNVLTDLGVMYRRNGESVLAVEIFDRAIAADPAHETSRFNKGIVLFYDLHDTAGALAAWKNLVDMNPDARTPQGKLVQDLIDEMS